MRLAGCVLVALVLSLAPLAHGSEGVLVVEGRVVDLAWPAANSAARPAAGLPLGIALRIQGALELEDAGGEWIAAATTGADGSFRAELADPGPRPLAIEVRAAADPEHRAGVACATLGPGERVASGLLLERAAHGALTGEVLDFRGRPLAGVRVGSGEARAETDAAGRFRIDPLRGDGPLGAELEGYAPASLRPEARPAGGWSPLRVELQPVGDLELSILGPRGEPLPELELALTPRDPSALPLERWEGGRAWRWTDAEGRARFEGVWAELPVELAVFGPDGAEWRLPRRVGRLIVPESDPDGRGIELERAGELALELRLGSLLTVRGRAVDPAGDPPLGRLYVRVCEVDPPGDGLSPGSQLRRPVGEDGRFELRLYRRPGLGRLVVSLGLGLDVERGTLDFALVDPERAVDGAIELELVASPRLAIRGRVPSLGLDAGDFAVRALPTELSRLQGRDALSIDARAPLEQDGSFELGNLPRGRYDLVLEERSACFGALARRFSGIEAGSFVELSPARERDVKIRVRALAPDGDVANLVVLAGRSFPRVERSIADGPPATRRHFADARSWPAAVAPVPGRVQTVESDEAITSCLPFAAAGDALALPAVEPGWYVLGVCARDSAGDAYAPVATEPLPLGAGFHELVFELRRTTRVVGRLVGGDADSRDPLRIEVVDEDGRAIALRKSLQGFTERARPKRDGSFVLHDVPVGEHRLWVGTDEELDTRRFRRELCFEARAEDEGGLEIELR